MKQWRYIPLLASMTWALCLCGAATVSATDEVASTASKPADLSTSAPIRSQLDSEPIRRGGESGSTSVTFAEPGKSELPRIAGALALVIGLIFLLRWGGKKLFNSGMPGGGTRAVQLLTRMAVAPGKHVLLLRVGQRIIVVGDAGSQMTSLSQITDADEIASLLGQLQDEKSRLPAKAFSAMFNRAKGSLEADDDEDEVVADSEEHSEGTGIGEQNPDDAAVVETRNEINGLVDKVRMLSRGIGSKSA